MRVRLGPHIAGLIGDPPLRILNSGTGWPMLARLESEDGVQRDLAMHVSNVGPHARRDYEFRFQNPGNRAPVDNANGIPLLIGLASTANGRAILIGLDGTDRVGRDARFSILFNRAIIEEAAEKGIAFYQSAKGEKIYSFRPELFAAFLEIIGAEEVPIIDVQATVAASDPPIGPDPVASERTRRAASILVRHHSFGRRVKQAYSGRCALCGLGLNLITSAHIYPASAPDSIDAISNGISLCPNHHAAFDSHDLWISADTRQTKFSPRYHAESEGSEILKAFIDSTFDEPALPENEEHHPDTLMFSKRYLYYTGKYDWA